MNKNMFVLSSALLAMSAVQASEFNGLWLGAKMGYNQSAFTGLDTQSAEIFGLGGGYNWDMDSYALGVAGFVDLNGNAMHNPGQFNYGSRVVGVDAKVGWPMGDWFPYAKLGYANTTGNGSASQVSTGGVHFGLGAEYKLTPELSIAGEFTRVSAMTAGGKLSNDTITLGLNYYFDTVHNEPAIASAEARELSAADMTKTDEPLVDVDKAPAKEVWKTLLEKKPVTFTGVHFDTKSAGLLPAEQSRLEDVAEFARLYPEAPLQITGHTDYRAGQSKKQYNLTLSEHRANAFKAALIKMGVAAERISTEGFGFEQPVADNNTAHGRAQNRRVEIRSVIKEAVRLMQ